MSIFKIFDDAKNYYKSEMKTIREVESAVRIVFTGFDVIEEFEAVKINAILCDLFMRQSSNPLFFWNISLKFV